MGFIISIDQGTTGSRVFLYNESGKVIHSLYREFTQYFPQPGYVEHDAMEIYEGVASLLEQLMIDKNLSANDIIATGITNQRETTVLWDKKTGLPVHRAIVWQCRRTSTICNTLKSNGHSELIASKTGLVIDAYFSASKIQWILDHHPEIKSKADRGEILFGTIDSWLLYKLTGEHKTDYTNASRTMLFNIHKKEWDEDLLKLFHINKSLLPEVLPSAHPFGKINSLDLLKGVKVLSLVGDQQGALFGQLCTSAGMAKNTYGTGCFLLFHTGDKAVRSRSGLLTTIACDAKGRAAYAIEGSVFIGGAVIQWLRDYMRFFSDASETEEIIKLEHKENIVFVPAFVGLGAPHWDQNARGAIFGITRDTTPADIIRASLKSIALQSYDLVLAMEKDTDKKLDILKVDGGAAKNQFLMQYQSDILGKKVVRPSNLDTTALGAAYLAMIQSGLFSSSDEISSSFQDLTQFEPAMTDEVREHELKLWHKAIDRSKDWLS